MALVATAAARGQSGDSVPGAYIPSASFEAQARLARERAGVPTTDDMLYEAARAQVNMAEMERQRTLAALLEARLAAKKAQEEKEEKERPQREAEMRRSEQELQYRLDHPSPQFQAQLDAQARYEMHRREKTKQGDSTPTPALTPAPNATASPSPIANSQQQDSLGNPSPTASSQMKPHNE
jgi:hypothetical protein